MDLYGSWRSDDNWTALEFGLYPCATRLELFDGSVQGGGDDCEWDKKAVAEYLGNGVSIHMLLN